MISLRKNILFSTTKNWNIGDEIILIGLENLLKELKINYNSIIFNRHPNISKYFDFLNVIKSENLSSRLDNNLRTLALRFVLESFFDIYHLDNSFHTKHMDKKWIDNIVFAGTPEWYSPRLKNLYNYAIKNKIPYYFVSIGIHPNLKRLQKSEVKYFLDVEKIISGAELIITRNCANDVIEYFKSLNDNVYYVGCPALFSYNGNIEYKFNDNNKKEVGFVISFPDCPHGHKITESTFGYIIKLIKTFSKHNYKINFILHYIDDFYYLKTKYKKLLEYCNGGEIYYSHNVFDYFDFYKNVDIIISTRVHGNGLASSLGIPNYNIPHDERSDTVLNFGSKILSKNLKDDFDMIISDDYNKFSNDIINFKEIKKEEFLKVLKKYFR